MKHNRILLLILVLTPIKLFSGEFNSWSQDNQRKSSDLMYMPKSRMFYLKSGYSFAKEKYDVDKPTVSTSQKFAEIEYKSQNISTEVGFGLFDRISFSVRVVQDSENQREYKYGQASPADGTTAVYETAGPTEPDANLKIRVIEQGKNGFRFAGQGKEAFNFDITLTYSPKWMTSKSPAATEKGNEIRGGQKIGGLLEVGTKFKKFSLMGSAGYNHYSKRQFVELEDSIDMEGQARSELTIELKYQYKLFKIFFLNFGFEHKSTFESKVLNLKTSVETTTSKFAKKSIILGCSLNIIPKYASLFFQLTHYKISEYNTTYSDSDDRLESSGTNGHSIGVSLLIQY